jgi:hypothetical protein
MSAALRSFRLNQPALVIGTNALPVVSPRHDTCRANLSRRSEMQAEAKRRRMVNASGIFNSHLNINPHQVWRSFFNRTKFVPVK